MSEDKKGGLLSILRGREAARPETPRERAPARSGPGVEGRGVDLAFVIDTTGSMSNKIQGLLDTCVSFVDEFGALGLDHRVAIVAFGDLTVKHDKIVATGFMQNAGAIKQSLLKIPRYSGGANRGESSLEAMQKAMQLPFRGGVVRVLILITDEPALESRNLKANHVTAQLRENEFLTFVISPSINYFKEMAHQNGGKWYKISARADFRGILDMFRKVAEDVSRVVDEAYRLGDGRVGDYLRLKPPEGR
jgi:hypothetical protein